MERIIYRKTLDVHKSGVQFTLQGFQTADNMSRTIELSLMASGDTIDLPLEQLMAVMYITTPNATEPSINECTIKDNNIVCDIQPIVEEGITEIQLKLIKTGVEGASGILATPKFAIEVSKSNTDEEGATQNTTFTALETALAQAKGVYDSRVTRIVLSSDCIFSVYYADGTVYTSDALRDVVVNGESLIAKSYARGGTGVRDGEDTDNSMYYSNVSKSASAEANRICGEAAELLQEATKHGVYTAFSIDFETGEVIYVSPSYSFVIDKESGELKAIGETYSFEETIKAIVTEWLNENGANINELAKTSEQHTEDIATNKADIEALAVTTNTLQNETIPSLENRIGNNETALNTLNTDYSSYKDTVSQRFATNEENIDKLEDDLYATQKSVETAHSNLATLTEKAAQIDTLNTRVNYLDDEESGIVNVYTRDFSYTEAPTTLKSTLSYFKRHNFTHIYGEFEIDLTDNFVFGTDNVFYLKIPMEGYYSPPVSPNAPIYFSVPCVLYDEVMGGEWATASASISQGGALEINMPSFLEGVTKIRCCINFICSSISKG